MKKVPSNDFLNSLLEGVPDGEFKHVELWIKREKQHWLISMEKKEENNLTDNIK